MVSEGVEGGRLSMEQLPSRREARERTLGETPLLADSAVSTPRRMVLLRDSFNKCLQFGLTEPSFRVSHPPRHNALLYIKFGISLSNFLLTPTSIRKCRICRPTSLTVLRQLSMHYSSCTNKSWPI